MVICQSFFNTYKRYDDLNPSLFAPYFELGYDVRSREPTFISANVFLHGMLSIMSCGHLLTFSNAETLHLSYLYNDFFMVDKPLRQIVDVNIYDRAISRFWPAYGAWAAKKVTEWSWVTKDNGVYKLVDPALRDPVSVLFNC